MVQASLTRLRGQMRGFDGARWGGSPVTTYRWDLPTIASDVPKFERRPFVLPAGAGRGTTQSNERFDVIVRQAMGNDPEMPVGIVSKRYSLVQHTEVIDAAREAILQLGIREEDTEADLQLTQHGERMALHIRLPKDMSVDPGDREPIALQLHCWNSVDGSMHLTSLLGWLRLVCSNGLAVGTTALHVRRVHSNGLSPSDITGVLREGLRAVEQERNTFRRWLDTRLRAEAIAQWINGPVRRGWGVKAACRAYHILTSGEDVEIADPFAKGLPTEKPVERIGRVPGAVLPGNNPFAASQALAYLASRRRDVGERLDRMREIPGLMEALVGRGTRTR